MLKDRVITAISLLVVLLPALFYHRPEPFFAVTLVLIVAAGWEWGRLNGCSQTSSLALAAVCLVLCAFAWYAGLLAKPSPLLWQLVGAAWVLAGAWLLLRGAAGWSALPKAIRLSAGVAVMCMAWLALAQARLLGIGFLLSVLLLVWVADVGAYVAGRSLGGRFIKNKLAPAISPGKSWEGVLGGALGVLLMAAAWVALDVGNSASFMSDSLYARLWTQLGSAVTLLAVVFLVAFSVVGDLVESLIKRSAGVKDSSNLLPGHGGVLDRVDALLPTLPLALMLVTL
ncbi:MAG: phosphatidate cytidylyltransferase [Chitinophagaceae bacterium]|nr:phosphatidate cytidylyltransferase [Polaromonas sp.]